MSVDSDTDALRKALGLRLCAARELLGLSKNGAADGVRAMFPGTKFRQRDVDQLEKGVKVFVPTAYIQFLAKRIDLNTLFDTKGEVQFKALPGELEGKHSAGTEKLLRKLTPYRLSEHTGMDMVSEKEPPEYIPKWARDLMKSQEELRKAVAKVTKL